MTEQWQELKETIIEMRDNDGIGTQKEVCKFLANLMDVLEKQMTNGWIPVSEKLPEGMGTYMTTVDYGKNGLATGQRYYFGQGWWDDDCVVAWMPLPEPYKAESEDKE